MNNSNNPIGVFDSGMDGLTTVKELIRLLPNEDIVYLGDTARVPYGNKSKQTIVNFSIQNTLYLLKFKVKLIVIACNTSSSIALNRLKSTFHIPIVGVIDPGVKKALALTKNNKIGVIGTNATIDSCAYQNRLKKLSPAVKVFARSCPLFVPLVEEGWLNYKVTQDIISKYLKPLKDKDIDTLILGCTHYPLLISPIHKVMGKKVALVNSAQQVAEEVKAIMQQKGIDKRCTKKGEVKFFLTDKPYRFKDIAQKFLNQRLHSVKTVKNIA